MRGYLIGISGLALILAAGCYQEVGREVFDKGEQLYLDQDYDGAIVAFRRYLVDHPGDAGAHFYLGTCYLASEDNKWLVLAEGDDRGINRKDPFVPNGLSSLDHPLVGGPMRKAEKSDLLVK